MILDDWSDALFARPIDLPTIPEQRRSKILEPVKAVPTPKQIPRREPIQAEKPVQPAILTREGRPLSIRVAPGSVETTTSHGFTRAGEVLSPLEHIRRRRGGFVAKDEPQAVSKFTRAMRHVFQWEGGFGDVQGDPGGRTKFGISEQAHPNINIEDLTEDRALQIYKNQYWEGIRGDDLPDNVAMSMMDFGVNAGVGRASRALQSIVGAERDGIIGPKTLAKVQEFVQNNGERALTKAVNGYRRGYYEGLTTADKAIRRKLKPACRTKDLPNYSKFGKGWENRLSDLESRIEAGQEELNG